MPYVPEIPRLTAEQVEQVYQDQGPLTDADIAYLDGINPDQRRRYALSCWYGRAAVGYAWRIYREQSGCAE
jgi:hypothetical protein